MHTRSPIQILEWKTEGKKYYKLYMVEESKLDIEKEKVKKQ